MNRSSRIRTAIVGVAALAVAACGRTSDLVGPPVSARDPIVFVHGYLSSASVWTTMMSRFRSDGWSDRQLVVFAYDFTQSNVATAQKLAVTIDSVLSATGAGRVDIVTHSMGSLVARQYVRNVLPAGSTKVDALVSLAGTNHGTTLAQFCSSVSCVEMRPGSTFLTALNAGDETWGTPRYATWWSACDEAVSPAASATLEGAANTETGCIRHSDIYIDATVYQQVRVWVHP